MAEALCGVCKTEPKKYKCPTCALPYCSLSCFQKHKPLHANDAPKPTTTNAPSLPQLPPPAPLPRYLKKKTDFSILATNPKFQNLLQTHPTLLSTLQRVYGKTIEPDPEDEARRRRLERQTFRGRGSRGRGRGRGRGGRWDRPERWTPKKGDSDAMGLLKVIRDGQGKDKEQEAMAEFVTLVGELFGGAEKEDVEV
ncbi:hypothetical protein ACN47E_007787 [Coniothyrium glycines]